jgi:Domain of unknown function (DUF5060)
VEEALGLVSGLVGVPRYGVFETTLSYPTGGLANPWEQVAVGATFTTPSGTHLNVDGFYYDVNTYKVRLTPAEIGSYTYSGSIVGPSGTQSFSGSFDSVPSSSHGFIRRVPNSSYQLQFEDGTFAALAGMNDCWDATQTNWIGDPAVEPPGESGSRSLDGYFGAYGDQEGLYNLFRWNPGNCSYDFYQSLDTSGNVYLVKEGQLGDGLLGTAQAHGFHVFFCFFQGLPPFVNVADGTPEADAIKRYLRYALARYGAYVDIWEMTNESGPTSVTDAWLAWTTAYVRSIDPYRRIVTNSNPRPTDPSFLDIQSPHLYGDYDDLYAESPKAGYIPTVSGESGALNAPIGGSALYQQDYQRVQLWTAIVGRTGIAWWNGSGRLPNSRNMYIGSKGRTTNRVLQLLVSGLEATAVSSQLSVAGTTQAYGLTGSQEVLAYITRYAGPHVSAPTTLTLSIPFANATAQWIDPGTGSVLQTFTPAVGTQTVPTPSFTTDVALVVRAGTGGCTSPSQCPPCGACQTATCVGGVCGCSQTGCTDPSQCPGCGACMASTCVNCQCGCTQTGCTDPTQCPTCPTGYAPTCSSCQCGCAAICGLQGNACCPGNQCAAGLVCDQTGTCQPMAPPCGGLNQPCCPSMFGGTCQGTLICPSGTCVQCVDPSQCPTCGPCQTATCVGGVCGCQATGCADPSQCPGCGACMTPTCVNCQCGCSQTGCLNADQCPACPMFYTPTCVNCACGCQYVGCTSPSQCPPCGACQTPTCIGGACGCATTGCTDPAQCPGCGACMASTCVNCQCGCSQTGCTDPSQCPTCPTGQTPTCTNCACGCAGGGGCTDPTQCPTCPSGQVRTCIGGACGCQASPPPPAPDLTALAVAGGGLLIAMRVLAWLERRGT